MLLRELRILLTAIIFFTRLPCSRLVENPQNYLASTSRYFPFVGWIVGGLGALVFWGAHFLWSAPVAVMLSVIATVLVTGALHEDGFIDVCDGFGGGWTKEHVLEIMKDSHIGTFGVLGIGLLMALKVLILFALPASIIPVALWIGHSISRFASISLLYTYDYVREDASSKSKTVVRKMTLGELFFAAVWGIAPLCTLILWLSSGRGGSGLLIMLACLAAVWLMRWGMGRYFFYKIGGYTGDCLGAVQQSTEVVFYMTLAVFFA
jgi:adenosylcobinamide-GDP ribazoletransferase